MHSLLHSNCNHHLTFDNLILKYNIHAPYEQNVCHCQKANIDQIRQSISEFPWNNHFENIKVKEQVQLFAPIIQNVILNPIHMKPLSVLREIHHELMRKSKN